MVCRVVGECERERVGIYEPRVRERERDAVKCRRVVYIGNAAAQKLSECNNCYVYTTTPLAARGYNKTKFVIALARHTYVRERKVG